MSEIVQAEEASLPTLQHKVNMRIPNCLDKDRIWQLRWLQQVVVRRPRLQVMLLGDLKGQKPEPLLCTACCNTGFLHR
jgi:hypothetical protein